MNLNIGREAETVDISKPSLCKGHQRDFSISPLFDDISWLSKGTSMISQLRSQKAMDFLHDMISKGHQSEIEKFLKGINLHIGFGPKKTLRIGCENKGEIEKGMNFLRDMN